MSITTPTVRGKRLDLWVDLAGLEEDRRLPCSSFATFCSYLFSESTKVVRVQNRCHGHYFWLKLVGPTADTGLPLTVLYKLTKEEWESLEPWVQKQVMQRLGQKREAAGFKDPEQAIRETFGGVA